MGKTRTGSIRERKTTYLARVTFIDEGGRSHKIERQSPTQKGAAAALRAARSELSARPGVRVTSEKIRERRGGVFARVTFVDDDGRRREIERRARNRSDAKEIIKDMLRDLEDHGAELLGSAQMTFNDLASHYEKNYLTAPEYVDGRKVAGLRSYASIRSRLATLKSHFGRRLLRTIAHGDLKRFKSERLKTRTGRKAQRSITTVHRELEVMRRMLNIAARQGWIKRNPFELGDALVAPGDERKRERILTRDEEARLLAACTLKRAHVRPIIVCALDTGMRRGEILKLVSSDLDFESRIITVRAFNTKTMRERQVAMTERLARELMAIAGQLPAACDLPLFGVVSDFRKSFRAACKEAQIAGLRFHDLRHTHATRLVAASMPLSEVGRMLGHTQANTTFRYVNANLETARRAAALIDAFNCDAGGGEDGQVIH